MFLPQTLPEVWGSSHRMLRLLAESVRREKRCDLSQTNPTSSFLLVPERRQVWPCPPVPPRQWPAGPLQQSLGWIQGWWSWPEEAAGWPSSLWSSHSRSPAPARSLGSPRTPRSPECNLSRKKIKKETKVVIKPMKSFLMENLNRPHLSHRPRSWPTPSAGRTGRWLGPRCEGLLLWRFSVLQQEVATVGRK